MIDIAYRPFSDHGEGTWLYFPLYWC